MRVEIPNQITVTIGGLISRGVKAVEVTDEGKLIFTLTDGSTVDLGSVIGPEGPKGETGPEGPAGPAGVKGDTGAAGASIMSIEKSSQSGTTSTYTITMSDGQTFDFEVQSDKGEKGDKGDTGATGPKGPQGEQGPAGIVVQETEPTGPEHPVWVNPKGGASDPSISGKDGTTFTPSVSASGDLSWTNDGGKENPETVNIKGPQGSPGITPNIQIGTVTTLPAGSDATASMGGTAENPVLNLGIPQGADGSGGSGGTDLSLGVTGAAVGQIAKITAVDADGKPTAWSPVDMPSGGGDGWELLKAITTEEAVAFLNFDLGKECSEVCVFISGKWITGLTNPFVVINMCSNDSYSEIGQTNVVYETKSFYNNNVRAVVADFSALSPGYWKVVATDGMELSSKKMNSSGAKFGLNSAGTFPNRCRYLHIGTHDLTHQYEAGLVIKIWGK